jgi:hypothetical protein
LFQSFRTYIKVLNALLVDICTELETWFSFQFSACRYTVFPAIFVEEAVFSPSYVFGALVKNLMEVAA